MQNNKKIVFIVIVNIILIGLICSFINIKSNVLKEKQVIKEMSESAQVSNLQTQINTLNKSHTDYANYIQESKGKIVTAINKKAKSSLTNESSTDDIVNVINSITNEDYIIENIKTYVNATGQSSNRIKNTFVNYTFKKAARVKITFAASCNTSSYGTSTSALIIGGKTIIYHNGYSLNYGSQDLFMDIEAGTNVTAYTIFNETDYTSYASCTIVGFDEVE